MINSQKKQKPLENTYQNSHSNRSSRNWFGRTVKTLKQLDGLITALATVLLFFATLALFCATRDLVQDAKHTSEKQLRAYVFLKDIRLEKSADGAFDIIPEWENTGVTETVNMTAYFNRYLSNSDLPNGFNFGDIEAPFKPVPNILGPKSVSNITFNKVAQKCLSQLNRRDGVTKFYVWGWTKYNDTFTKSETFPEDQHITRFCWDVDRVIFSADGKSARLAHSLCDVGNCADKQCHPPEKFTMMLPQYECKPEPATVEP